MSDRDSARNRRYSLDAFQDPNMMWQTYKACKQREEEAQANDTLFKYASLWLSSANATGQAVRYRLDPHLLPSLAFAETSSEWLLQTRPSGLFGCLDELVTLLGAQITSDGSRKTFVRTADTNNRPIIQLSPLTRVILNIICCPENLVAVTQTKLLQTTTDICNSCLSAILSRNFESENSIGALLNTIGNCVAIIHILCDPRHNWLKTISQNSLLADGSVMDPVTITHELVKTINDTYTLLDKYLQGKCESEYKSLQLEMLHLLGAILSGSKENAEIAVLSLSETLPFMLLEPREMCTPLQVLTVRMLIRMIHVLHCLIPEELLSHIDVRVLLSGLFNIMSPRWKEGVLIPPHPELVISILDSFNVLCAPPTNCEGLKEILVHVAVMEKVCEVLNTLKDAYEKSQDLGHRLSCTIIRAYGCVMYQNVQAQEAFEQRVGYGRFRKQVSSAVTPTKEILLELLNLVIEDNFSSPSKETITIHNTSIVCMLLRWLPSLPKHLRKWLVQHLFDLSTTAVHNRQQCCEAGVLRVIVDVLAKSQSDKKYVGKQVEDKLIELVEILGSHSVVAAELKQIIGSLRTTEDGKLPTYYYRLQQALCTMASNKEGTTPLYYFDLRQPGSHISIPDLKTWPNSNGFTFHVWVCLNVPSSLGHPIQGGEQLLDDRRKCRRMLYSFYTRNGMGFEAFFTRNMNLVVATSTKKQFHSFTIQQPTFRSSDWHKITIVNNLGRRWGKNEITVYIDGQHVGTAYTKSPSDKRYIYSYIGAHHSTYRRKSHAQSATSSYSKVEPASDCHTSSNSFTYDGHCSDEEPEGESTSLSSSLTAATVLTVGFKEVETEWGHPEHLTGLISTVCVFSDVLSPSNIQTLHNYRPNALSLFQPKCDHTQELASKVLFYFHPKACRDGNCVNLLANVTGTRYDGQLSGEPYVTWDVKDVLNSLGGMELLFPILENVGISPKQITELEGAATNNGSRNDDYDLYGDIDGKKDIFNEQQGAAAFIHLLVAMLDGSYTNQEVFSLCQGPATVGALLQKVCPAKLTNLFLSAIQRLTEIFRRNTTNKSYLYNIQKHILFNFSIWCLPSMEVRKEHIEYLMTIISDEQEHCRAKFGVEFMLDVLRIHYSRMGSTSTHTISNSNTANDEESVSIRSAIINAMKLYVMNNILKDEVDCILKFLTACQDSTLIEEILRFLLSILNTCSSGDTLGRFLWLEGTPLIVFVQAENTNVRLLAIKILSTLIKKHSDITSGPLYNSLQNGSLAAAVRHMTIYDIPSSVVLALLELCTAKGSDLTEYISSFPLYMAVLQLLRSVKLVVRHTVCHQFISLLQLNPAHIDNIVSYPAWESLFLWLLCKQDSTATDTDDGSTLSHDKTTPTNDNGAEAEMTDGSDIQSHDQIINYSYTHWYGYFNEDDDVYRTFAVVTETIGYILWHQINQEGGLWLTWGHLLAALDEFTGKYPLIVPDFIVKQRLFSLLMNAVSLESRRPGVTQSSLCKAILQLSQLLETFVMKNYPSCISSSNVGEIENSMDIIRGVSHSIDLVLDLRNCCIELLNQYLDMLNSSGLLGNDPYMNQDSVKLSILQSSLRILLAAISSNDQQHYTLGAARLLSIVHTGALEKQDVFFLLRHLAKSLDDCLMEDSESDHTHHLCASIREMFIHYSNVLKLTDNLPHLPEPMNGPAFCKSIVRYVEQDEWKRYKANVLIDEASKYNIVLFPWLSICLRRRQECVTTYHDNDNKRRQRIYGEQDAFEEQILQPFSERRDEEVQRQKTSDSLCHTDVSSQLRQWRATRKFFTGERGAWSNRVPDPYLWGLSRTENFSRMRMKAARLYTVDNHSEAARLRDQVERGTINNLKQEDKSLLQKAARTGTMNDDDFEEEIEKDSKLQDDGLHNREEEEEEVKENTVRTEKCEVIVLMEKVTGRLEITNKHIYFFVEQLQQEKKDLLQWYNPEFKVRLTDLREIHSRRYNMARTGLELFLVDQTNYFINFQSRKIVRRVYSSILQQKTPNLNRVGIRNPARLLQTAGLTDKWRKREISNFDYLMQLNTIAGRMYNDLNQYPIFPWVLKDFSSDELDLSNPLTYRDFSLPMGAQNPNKREELEIKYKELEDPVLGSFHHGSHYSSAAGVLHYLVRLEPFTTLHIDLQDGRFDVADRQFISLPATAANIYKGRSSDVKELIPEFFFLPDFLTNVNLFDLGVRVHTGQKIDDVILPPWAKSPEDFIQKHKEALESEYVSEHLHEWIDLIFGYKQSGPEGVKAYNMFLKYSYEENVNLEDMKDENEKRKIEAIINNFGQTPTKLFQECHVKRWSLEQCRKNPGKGMLVGTRKSHINVFEKLDKLKAYGVDISVSGPECSGVVFVGTPTIQTRAILVSGNPEPLVTITSTGLLNVHGWLPFSSARRRPFSFQFDPNSHFDKARQYIGAPFAQDIIVSHHLFVLSPNNKLLIMGGHWDNSFRVVQIDRGKLTKRINHHTDIVTCMSLDKTGTGEHLVTGSRDTTCVIWKLKQESISDLPLVTLYGHDHEVLCVDISTELDIVVSGDKDGTCIVHTVRGGSYVYTIKPRPRHVCEIRHVAISNQGRILVYSQGPSGKNRSLVIPPCIHLYSINGKLLFEKELAEPLNDLLVVGQIIITGNDKGFLTFRELNSLRQLNSLNLLDSIRCISVVLHHQSKVCTHLLVGLKNGKLIIVTADQ